MPQPGTREHDLYWLLGTPKHRWIMKLAIREDRKQWRSWTEQSCCLMALDTDTLRPNLTQKWFYKSSDNTNITTLTKTDWRRQDRRKVRDGFFHGTTRSDFPCNIICSVTFSFASLPICSCSPFHNKEFIPEWDFLLWELHVISDEESLRVLSLPIGNDASIELDNRWQPACRHQEIQSARRETQTGWPTRESPWKATCHNTNTRRILPGSLGFSPLKREGESHAVSPSTFKIKHFHFATYMHRMHRHVWDSKNSLRSKEVRLNISTTPTFPHHKKRNLKSFQALNSYKTLSPNSLFLQLPTPAILCHVTLLLSRINKQQTWLLAASGAPQWCRTAAKGFLAILLPRAWEKNLTCQCPPSNADLLGRKDLLKQTQIIHHVSKIIRHSQRTYTTGRALAAVSLRSWLFAHGALQKISLHLLTRQSSLNSLVLFCKSRRMIFMADWGA